MFVRTIALIISLCLAGCGEIGMIASPMQTFTTNDTLALQRPAKNFVQAATDAGKALKYDLSGVNGNTLTFADNTSIGMGMLVGKMGNNTLTVALQPGDRIVKFDIMLMGNFDQANQEVAAKRLSDFKRELTARIN